VPQCVIHTQVLTALDVPALFSLRACCNVLQLQINQPQVWKRALHERHRDVIRILFDGRLPPPDDTSAHGWRRHLLTFETSWLEMARASTGRCLLQMSQDCVNSDSSYLGVPPPRSDLTWKGTVSLPFTSLSMPISFALSCRQPYRNLTSIFDVTPFVEEHPGTDRLLLDAAEPGCDATQLFDRAAHSDQARALLRSMMVPGLEAIPPILPADCTHHQPEWSWPSATRARMKRLLWGVTWTFDATL